MMDTTSLPAGQKAPREKPPAVDPDTCPCGLTSKDDGPHTQPGCAFITPCKSCGGILTHGDGCPDQIVLDGTTGGVVGADGGEPAGETGTDAASKTITVDGKDAVLKTTPAQTDLGVDQPMDDNDVLRGIAECVEVEARLRTEANKAKNALSHASKKTRAAVEYAAQYFARTRQITMNFAVGGTIPDDDAGDDGGGGEE